MPQSRALALARSEPFCSRRQVAQRPPNLLSFAHTSPRQKKSGNRNYTGPRTIDPGKNGFPGPSPSPTIKTTRNHPFGTILTGTDFPMFFSVRFDKSGLIDFVGSSHTRGVSDKLIRCHSVALGGQQKLPKRGRSPVQVPEV